MEVEGARLLLRDGGELVRRRGFRRMVLGMVVVVMAVGAATGPQDKPVAAPAPASCHGRVLTMFLPRDRYPGIDAHIVASWAAGYPRTLRINRSGAAGRRARLLGWWQERHPQRKGDGLDLDEAPAAALRSSWRADVRPIPAHENRSAGSSLGAQIAGYPDGTCVRYSFTRRPR
jgi:hypothetical protein